MGGGSMDHVRSCTMDLRSDLDQEVWSPTVPGLEVPVYECVMSIVDDRWDCPLEERQRAVEILSVSVRGPVL